MHTTLMHSTPRDACNALDVMCDVGVGADNDVSDYAKMVRNGSADPRPPEWGLSGVVVEG